MYLDGMVEMANIYLDVLGWKSSLFKFTESGYLGGRRWTEWGFIKMS
jgi:hypothetical protein